MASPNEELVELFQNTTLREVLAHKPVSAPRELVSVNIGSSVSACLTKMISAKVTSIPLMDDSGKCVGIVDMRDIAATLVANLSSIDEWKTWPDIKFSELLENAPVKNVVDFAHGDPL